MEYISDEVERYYFGKIKEYAAQNILNTKLDNLNATRTGNNRIEVIDLPSFPDNKTRLLALNSVLATEWGLSRNA